MTREMEAQRQAFGGKSPSTKAPRAAVLDSVVDGVRRFSASEQRGGPGQGAALSEIYTAKSFPTAKRALGSMACLAGSNVNAAGEEMEEITYSG